jgi:4-hydroxy-tetrahydrodipicolinate synthase
VRQPWVAARARRRRRSPLLSCPAMSDAARPAPELRLRGLFAVLPTAFTGDGALDLDGLTALVRANVAAGAAGLTVLGVMGEAAELDEDERRDVVGTVRRSAGEVPMIVGVTGTDPDQVRQRAGRAVAAGASGLMVSPSPAATLVEAVAAAATAGAPLIVQDYPAASGVHLTAEDIAATAEREPLVIGAKIEAPPTTGKIASLRRLAPHLGVVGGLGGLFLVDELRAGATGVMTGAAVPERLVAILDGFTTDPGAAELAWLAILPLLRFEAFQPFSLAARKEVWRLRGVIESGYCRRPGASLDDGARADIRRAVEAIGLRVDDSSRVPHSASVGARY